MKRNEDDITLETKCPELSTSIVLLTESICHARSKHKSVYFPNKVYFVINCKLYYIKNSLTRWKNAEIIVGSVRRTEVVMSFTLNGFSYLNILWKIWLQSKNFLTIKKHHSRYFSIFFSLSLKLRREHCIFLGLKSFRSIIIWSTVSIGENMNLVLLRQTTMNMLKTFCIYINEQPSR